MDGSGTVSESSRRSEIVSCHSNALRSFLPPMPLAYVDGDEDVPRICLGEWLISEELASSGGKGGEVEGRERERISEHHDRSSSGGQEWRHDEEDHFLQAQRDEWRLWHRRRKPLPRRRILSSSLPIASPSPFTVREKRRREEAGADHEEGDQIDSSCAAVAVSAAPISSASSTSRSEKEKSHPSAPPASISRDPDSFPNSECGAHPPSCSEDRRRAGELAAYAMAFESSLSALLQVESCHAVWQLHPASPPASPLYPGTDTALTAMARQKAGEQIARECEAMILPLGQLKELVGQSDWLVKHLSALRMVEQEDFATRLSEVEKRRKFSEQTIQQLRKAVEREVETR